jgi:hypothetical protein
VVDHELVVSRYPANLLANERSKFLKCGMEFCCIRSELSCIGARAVNELPTSSPNCAHGFVESRVSLRPLQELAHSRADLLHGAQTVDHIFWASFAKENSPILENQQHPPSERSPVAAHAPELSDVIWIFERHSSS